MGKKQNDVYEVKDVLAYKKEGSKEYFLVWWEGYPKGEATWEPISNLQDIDGYDEYYKNLKQSYDLNQRKGASRAKIVTKNDSQEEKQSESQQWSSKCKKIQKVKRELRSNSKKSKQQARSGNESLSQEELAVSQEEIVEDGSDSPQIIRADKKTSAQKARLKRLLNSAPAIQFQIKIKQFKQLPFLGQKIKQIKQAFTRNGQTMYEVELAESKAMTQPVILHQNFIKVLWPKQFASYLLSKQRT